MSKRNSSGKQSTAKPPIPVNNAEAQRSIAAMNPDRHPHLVNAAPGDGSDDDDDMVSTDSFVPQRPSTPTATVASGAAAQLPVRPPTATATTTTRPATTPKTPPMQRIQPAIASTVAGSLPAVAANNSDERYVLESKIEMYMQYFGDELQTTIGVNWSNKSTDQLRKICDDCERRLSIGGERELVAHATTGLAYGMEMMAPVLPAPLTYAVGFHELVKTQVDDPKSPIGRAVTRLGIRYLGRLPANHPFMALAGALALTMWRMGDAVQKHLISTGQLQVVEPVEDDVDDASSAAFSNV